MTAVLAPGCVPSGLGCRGQVCVLSRCTCPSTKQGQTWPRSRSMPSGAVPAGATAAIRPSVMRRSNRARPSASVGPGRSSNVAGAVALRNQKSGGSDSRNHVGIRHACIRSNQAETEWKYCWLNDHLRAANRRRAGRGPTLRVHLESYDLADAQARSGRHLPVGVATRPRRCWTASLRRKLCLVTN